jgi:hypothetical protein
MSAVTVGMAIGPVSRLCVSSSRRGINGSVPFKVPATHDPRFWTPSKVFACSRAESPRVSPALFGGGAMRRAAVPRWSAVVLSHGPARPWRPRSSGLGESALERGRDVLNGGELVGGERLDEELADGP